MYIHPSDPSHIYIYIRSRRRRRRRRCGKRGHFFLVGILVNIVVGILVNIPVRALTSMHRPPHKAAA